MDLEQNLQNIITPEELKALRERDCVDEIKSVLRVIANNMAIPLYLLFWVSDILYVPDHMWEFLGIRLLIIPLCFSIQYLVKRMHTFFQAQMVAVLFNVGMSSAINFMIFRIGQPSTPYYAGLNLIALGNLAFIPWSPAFYLTVAFAIFGPYYAITLLQSTSPSDFLGVALNSFFIFSTILMLFYIRFFNEKLRQKELSSRLALRNEVANRDEIISTKSQETIKLASLSRQFSPQVVEAIRQNRINLAGGVHRAEICAIFIDIVNSTEGVTRVNSDSVHRVVSMFMDDTIRTLLKYDITVDKFLGDGILAFANDPVHHPDFVERVVKAALEVKDKILSNHEEYEKYWLNPLKIRIGIASGLANVGFYGNERYYKTYTSIGPVINLASRLCATAQPDQIVATRGVVLALDPQVYSFTMLGRKSLKGFEAEHIETYCIDSSVHAKDALSEMLDCPVCITGALVVDVGVDGIFVLKCRDCGQIDMNTSPKRSEKLAA